MIKFINFLTVKTTIVFLILISGCTSIRKGNNPQSSDARISLSQPVINIDFPDPTVINVNGKFYAYATNRSNLGKKFHIQVASSTDLQHWKLLGDALPQGSVWAARDFWAPHVIFDKELNKYVMFYSGESIDEKTGKCLGVAFSDKPEGPFIDKGAPLFCGEGFINIDPMAIIDPKSGKKLLYWGSGHGPIKVQELADDWKTFKPGTVSKPLVFPFQEKNYDQLVEGAWIDIHDGYYYLYYSGDNCCGDKAKYAVLVARSNNPLGPFQSLAKAAGIASSAILEKDSEWLAPGHNSIFRDEKGNAYIAYHAIPINKIRSEQKYGTRVMLIKNIEYEKGWPLVK